jgi:hypothetical protein
VPVPPGSPAKPFEQIALEYVSAVQNKDEASARGLACASYQGQVTVEPTLRSPDGVTVDTIDTYRVRGSSAISDSPEHVFRANVGVGVSGGGHDVLWVFKLLPDRGELRVCGQSVLEGDAVVPSIE